MDYKNRILEDALLDGSLPGIQAVVEPRDRESELSATEVGGIINLRALASDVGVAQDDQTSRPHRGLTLAGTAIGISGIRSIL